MSQIFISYKREDKPFADALQKRLGRYFNIWQDVQRLYGGDNFNQKIEQAIRQSTAMILVLSPEALASKYIWEKEVPMSQNMGVRIIPYVYKPCTVPDEIRSNTNIIFHQGNDVYDQEAFEKLLDACRYNAPEARHHQGEEILVSQIGTRANYTFEEVALGNAGVLRVTLNHSGESLVGLPIKFSRYHAAYLVGRAKDTLEETSSVQLAWQLTDRFQGEGFVQQTAHFFSELPQVANKLRMILVRNMRHPDKFGEHGYGDEPNEWDDVVAITQDALGDWFSNTAHYALQITVFGPNDKLYELGVKQRGNYQVQQYHYDRDRKRYTPITKG